MDKTLSIPDKVNVSTSSSGSVQSMDTTCVQVILPSDEKDSSREDQVIRRSTRPCTNRFAFVLLLFLTIKISSAVTFPMILHQLPPNSV
jgi:hypothetical protein